MLLQCVKMVASVQFRIYLLQRNLCWLLCKNQVRMERNIPHNTLTNNAYSRSFGSFEWKCFLGRKNQVCKIQVQFQTNGTWHQKLTSRKVLWVFSESLPKSQNLAVLLQTFIPLQWHKVMSRKKIWPIRTKRLAFSFSSLFICQWTEIKRSLQQA